jgi:hypothetical protein
MSRLTLAILLTTEVAAIECGRLVAALSQCTFGLAIVMRCKNTVQYESNKCIYLAFSIELGNLRRTIASLKMTFVGFELATSKLSTRQ